LHDVGSATAAGSVAFEYPFELALLHMLGNLVRQHSVVIPNPSSAAAMAESLLVVEQARANAHSQRLTFRHERPFLRRRHAAR
jgi:hypothetical protein